MSTFKKLMKYFVLFILLFLFVSFFKELGFRRQEKEEGYMMNYNVKVKSPKIMVQKSRTTESGGYINGYILNDTKEHIKDGFIQVDFYDSKGKYLGMEYKEIKYFNVKEKINFDIQYEYKNVDRIDIDFVDKINKIENKEEQKDVKDNEIFSNIKPEINNKTVAIGTFVGAFLLAGTATILLP